jgi:monovalent cation:H+ antiporter, CPA1 family
VDSLPPSSVFSYRYLTCLQTVKAMQQYQIFAFIIGLAAFFSYVNHRVLKLSPTIGITALSLLAAMLLLLAAHIFPQQVAPLIELIAAIDFRHVLLDIMLGLMLFAGAMHIDAQGLSKQRVPVAVLATVGIFISTFLIGSAVYLLLGYAQLPVAYIHCLLFAALISPTDPIAVLAILKTAGLPKPLELKIAGESLFNDGVAVVLFLTLLQVATMGIDTVSPSSVALLFLREAVGGLLFGLALGYLGYWANRTIDKYEVEVLITIATATSGYVLAGFLHVSGPLAMVVAGIVIGNKSMGPQTSDVTRDYLFKFWELADEILNALLFMLLGFEMLTIQFDTTTIVISLATVGVVVLARLVSVALPVTLMRRWIKLSRSDIALLSWGGLRGGLSVALALSLPVDMNRKLFVFITFVVVVFSIFAQGLTIKPLFLRLKSRV